MTKRNMDHHFEPADDMIDDDYQYQEWAEQQEKPHVPQQSDPISDELVEQHEQSQLYRSMVDRNHNDL